jgi:hypothetical protein
LLKAGKPTEAEPLLRTCLPIRRQKERDAWTTFNAQSLLGETLAGQQQFADAESLLRDRYEGLKQRAAKMPVNAKKYRIEVLERLVHIYDAWGKREQVKEWRKQLDQAKPLTK